MTSITSCLGTGLLRFGGHRAAGQAHLRWSADTRQVPLLTPRRAGDGESEADASLMALLVHIDTPIRRLAVEATYGL
jgi:hypothetical protein